MNIARKSIDSPKVGSTHSSDHIAVEGWLDLGELESDFQLIEARVGEVILGQSSILFVRSDVNAALALNPRARTGFRFLGSLGAQTFSGETKMGLWLKLRSQEKFFPLAEIKLNVVDLNLVSRDYGVLVSPDFTKMVGRSDIYSTGPSSPVPSFECVELIKQYLTPGSSVLDVGCGIGAYATPLTQAGFKWFGIEVKESDCVELSRRELPHQQVEPGPLPFSANQFDNAICIEVLEHIHDYHSFLSEISRVVRSKVVFSVPNSETIPRYRPLHIVPWHLLEGDHKNFFSRYNLKPLLLNYFREVELFNYGPLPVPTLEGLTTYNHWCAVASK